MFSLFFRHKISIICILGFCAILGILFYAGFFKESTFVIENSKEEDLSLKQEDLDFNEKKLEIKDENEENARNEQKKSVIKENDAKNLSQKEDFEQKNDLKIIKKFIGFGYEVRNSREIDTIIIHSSYDALGSDPFDVEGIISEYKQYGVSAHYLIDRRGMIYQLVEDKNIAYHAGAGSVPDGRNGVNEFSIGIEMVNTKKDKYTNNQYDALNSLLKLLKNKYRIKHVLGHNQIAPERKDDPWNFEWNRIQ